MLQYCENAHIYDALDELPIIDYNTLCIINSDIKWWPGNGNGDCDSNSNNNSERKKLHDWLLEDDVCKGLYIPFNLVHYARYFSKKHKGNQIFCVIEWDEQLVGVVGFMWGDKQYLYNNEVPFHDGIRRVYVGTFMRSLISHPMSLKNANIKNHCGLRYIPLVSRDTIVKREKNLFYDETQMHSIGFVKQEIDMTITEDMKEYFNFLGMMGQSSIYACIWCFISQMERRMPPSPTHLENDPRDYDSILETSFNSSRGKNDARETYSQKSQPLCKYYPHTLGSCFIHQGSGVATVIVKPIKFKILQVPIENKKDYDEYHQLEIKLFDLKDEIMFSQNQNRQMQNQNSENREVSKSPSPFCENHHYDSDNSDYDTNEIQQRLQDLYTQQTETETRMAELKKKLNVNANRQEQWDNYKYEAKFDELSYRDNDMTGPASLNFVNNYEKLLELVKPLDSEIFRICKVLLSCSKFLFQVGQHI